MITGAVYMIKGEPMVYLGQATTLYDCVESNGFAIRAFSYPSTMELFTAYKDYSLWQNEGTHVLPIISKPTDECGNLKIDKNSLFNIKRAVDDRLSMLLNSIPMHDLEDAYYVLEGVINVIAFAPDVACKYLSDLVDEVIYLPTSEKASISYIQTAPVVKVDNHNCPDLSTALRILYGKINGKF